jgi:quercetin 2,3-dioxygenase
MVKLCEAENRNLFENNFLRINALNETNTVSNFSFIDDVAINGSGSYQKVINESGYIILLPLLNNIRLDMNGFKWKIEANQAFVYYLTKGSIIEIEGEFEHEYSYFYSLFLTKEKEQISKMIVPIDLERDNRLEKIIRHDLFNVFIGKFDLRKEAELPLKRTERSWLILSITGIFEVHNRLIESRDLLQISSDEHIDFESLSENSLLMVIDY